MLAVVSALLTVCVVAGDEVLVLKLASPLYVAVRLLVPTEVNVMSHVPADNVPVQLSVPSLTVTLPVGAVGVVPVLEVMLKVTVTGCPVTEAVLDNVAPFVIAVVVSALLTVRLSTLELAGDVLSLSTLAEMRAVPAAVAWKLPVAVPAA